MDLVYVLYDLSFPYHIGSVSHDFRTFEEIEKFVLQNCRKGDLLITMGAGNVNTVAKDLLS